MRAILVLCVMWFGCLAGYGQSDYINTILEERAKIDSVFQDTSKHILTQAEVESFQGLSYFEIDTTYRIEARFRKRTKKVFEMPTSTKRKPLYRQYGYVKFELNGQRHKLYIYQQMILKEKLEPAGDYLFCPFRDATNRDSTYGGGRYMDFKLGDISGKTLVLDFNTCYNPYCAYSHRYSCPVTPKENTLDIRIEAGVKKWH